MFPYGCPGSEHYIEDLIRLQDRGGDSFFLIATSGGELLGFVEARRFADSICLNYSATAEYARGLGVFKKLFKELLILAKEEGYSKAFLDVFWGNTIREFHERIGYQVTQTLIWLAISLPHGEPAKRIVLVGLPQADIIHKRYGFSQFTLIVGSNQYQVGRLNNKWFRITQPNLLFDPNALFALNRLDPARSILLISEKGSNLPPDIVARQELGSYRLEGNIDQVLGQMG